MWAVHGKPFIHPKAIHIIIRLCSWMYAWCRMEEGELGRRADDDYGIHPECGLYVPYTYAESQPKPEPTYRHTSAHYNIRRVNLLDWDNIIIRARPSESIYIYIFYVWLYIYTCVRVVCLCIYFFRLVGTVYKYGYRVRQVYRVGRERGINTFLLYCKVI